MNFLTTNAILAIWHDFLWCLIVFGMTNIVVISRIFEPFRNAMGKVTTLFRCPMCLGFWVGGGLGFWWRSPTGNLFLDAVLGSTAAWLIFLLVHKRQEDL